jgi:hypothetical protein
VKRNGFTLAAIFCVVLLSQTWFARIAQADASYALGQALGSLRALGPTSFGYVVQWANSGAPQVPNPTQDYEYAEAQILNLNNGDRQAVLLWLQGSGRSALYARGATDDQIGPLRPGVDAGASPQPSATPNPWRNLKLASTTLGTGTPASNIVLLNGFVAAKRDGTSAIACISFKNVAPQSATRVVVDFSLLDANGQYLAPLVLDRRGTFSPNVEIHSYPSFDAWSGTGYVNRDYANGCVRVDNGVAAIPILAARLATYRITRVEYADGTVWTSASPAPVKTP